MGILTRILRLFKADVHGVMDQIEDPALLLRQHLREMEKALDEKALELKRIQAQREALGRDHARNVQTCDNLEKDLAVAIEKEKDEIARILIKKLKPHQALKDELSRRIQDLDHQTRELSECLERWRGEFERLQLRASAFMQKTDAEPWTASLKASPIESFFQEPCAEEVELELIKRKAAMKGETA